MKLESVLTLEIGMVFDLEGIGMVRMEFDHACSLDRIGIELLKELESLKYPVKSYPRNSMDFNGFLYYQRIPMNKTKELEFNRRN